MLSSVGLSIFTCPTVILGQKISRQQTTFNRFILSRNVGKRKTVCRVDQFGLSKILRIGHGGDIGQNTAKTSVKRPLAAKPEVEIWRRPDI